MKKFSIEDYINWDKIIINDMTLIEEYWFNNKSARYLMKDLLNRWLIVKLNKGNYLFVSMLEKINNHELIMLLDPYSYIWTYTVLERKLIKQAHTTTFAISNNNNIKNEELIKHRRIQFKTIKIPLTFWIEVIKRVRYSDIERSLLDLIYLHVFTWYPITSELYLKWNIDEIKIQKYLNYYPERVSNFYYNKLQEYAK